jgi:hypothetical protein
VRLGEVSSVLQAYVPVQILVHFLRAFGVCLFFIVVVCLFCAAAHGGEQHRNKTQMEHMMSVTT